MAHFNETMDCLNDKQVHAFVQTYSSKQGLKRFGEKEKQTVNKEMKQLHNRKVFEPIHINKLTKRECERAMESLIFLAEKCDKSIKTHACAVRSTQHSYIAQEEATRLTAATKAILITGVIGEKQDRDVMTVDTPNALV